MLRKHPGWQNQPAAVVDRDHPQGVILWSNDAAQAFRILPGMRYAAGLSLCRDLRAGVISTTEISKAVKQITKRLRNYSPEVESSTARDLDPELSDKGPGIFWLGAAGLKHLYGSLERWAELIHADLRDAGFTSHIAVGFSRFGTYAIARATRTTNLLVFRSPVDEVEAARKVPLDRLELHPDLRETLYRLGIRTIGAFLRLPAEGLRNRFGPEAHRLHTLATGSLWDPLLSDPLTEPRIRRFGFEDAEIDRGRLTRRIEEMLYELLDEMQNRQELLSELHILFVLESRETLTERIRPAAPTLEAKKILRLLSIRIEQLALLSGVTDLTLFVRAVRDEPEQLGLFTLNPRRDLKAADEAFAQLRARFGTEAVATAELRDGHLPEARFDWTPLDSLPTAEPTPAEIRPMIRRFQAQPIRIAAPYTEKDWCPIGRDAGTVETLQGPYITSGGWWRREIHREYYFAHTTSGDIYWIYYDRPRDGWFLHGKVE
jgi:protein ImuB